MKDRVFTGQDVDEALASAAASLGLPMRELRYVVLDPGTAAARGLKPTPAQIAVLLQEQATGGRGPAPMPAGEAGRGGPRREGGPRPAAPVRFPRCEATAISHSAANAPPSLRSW